MAAIVRNIYILMRRTTIHHMVPGTLEFDSQWTSHGGILQDKALDAN